MPPSGCLRKSASCKASDEQAVETIREIFEKRWISREIEYLFHFRPTVLNAGPLEWAKAGFAFAPPVLGDGCGCNGFHIRTIVISHILKVAEEIDAMIIELLLINGIILDVGLLDDGQNFRPGIGMKGAVLIDVLRHYLYNGGHFFHRYIVMVKISVCSQHPPRRQLKPFVRQTTHRLSEQKSREAR